MKKIIGVFIVTVFCLSFGYSQNPDKNSVGKYNYIRLPLKPLPKEYKSYVVEVSTASGDKYIRDIIMGGINVAGFQKSADGSFDFKVFIDEYPYETTKPEQKTSVKKYTKDGVEKTETYYYYVWSSSYKIKAVLYNQTNEPVYNKEFDLGGNHSTGEKGNPSDAYKEYGNMLGSNKQNAMKNGIGNLNSDLNNLYGYYPSWFTPDIYTIKAKKFDYSDFDQAFTLANEACQIVIGDENAVDAARGKFEEAIAIWNKALAEFNPEVKKARVDKDVAFAATFNIAISQLLMKQYNECVVTVEKCRELKKSGGGILELKNLAEDMQKRAAANAI
ncbi:MAG: hypothetical protein JXB00_11835 [Bacteroidales bacterium]|nr:hypothetical protein [Bacteroidales bacterium]